MTANNIKYIKGKLGVIELRKNQDGFWTDSEGCLYAYAEAGMSKDEANRCGIAPFAVPEWDCFRKLNDGCKPHDYAYNSLVYQAFHTRSEADEYLEELQRKNGYPVIGWLFKKLSRLFGGGAWENDRTR